MAAAISGLAAANPAKAQPRLRNWIPPAELIAELPNLMGVACLPGLSAAVVENGSLVWSRALGISNATTAEAVREDTLFEAASMSKAVFAYAVLQFSDRQKLDLDRPLASYFKPAYLPADPQIDLVTARHVLTHSSGLPNWGEDDKPESFKPAFPPGRSFSYSGEGFFWLQLVLEHLTGTALDVFMRSQLFEPAGMRSSTFVGDAKIAPNVSWGHTGGKVAAQQGWRDVTKFVSSLEAKWGKPVREWRQEDWIRAAQTAQPNATSPKRVRFANCAGSLLTTASDHTRFLALLMARPNRASWEISEATRRAMITPQIAVRKGIPLWWGHGVQIEKDGDGWRVGHEGNNDGRFTAYCGIDPEKGHGLVIMTNGGSGFGVYQRIVRAATGLDQLSFIAETHPPPE
jgi:CubicO group peptidase (beta-lactamase class C family)